MARLSVLLPESRRLAGQALAPVSANALGRAERVQFEAAGEVAQLRRYFELPDAAWPIAALTREFDAGDAGDALWLRADPVHVRPDMTGVRMLAHGELGLLPDDAAILVEAVQPLFSEQGWRLSAPDPRRWYLQLPPGLDLPDFAPPQQVLGDDLFGHLPEGAAGRVWRGLLNEAQILLHQHPLNERRSATGRPAVNSLWFWGAGCLPGQVLGRVDAIESDEADLRALASIAASGAEAAQHRLLDQRDARDWARFESAHLLPALQALRQGRLERLALDFADGLQFVITPRQRWKLWRRPITALT